MAAAERGARLSGHAATGRRRLLVATLAVATLVAAPAAADAVGPAEAALRGGDAYVSPRVLGPAAPAAERRLAEGAAAMAAQGRPVKLAVVLGPVGSPSLPAYARRLAGRLGYEDTLLITTGRGGVAAVGPLPARDMTLAIRAARAGAIPDPVDRLLSAAAVAAPPPVDERGDLLRPALTLLALAALGGGWAAALGVGRQARVGRRLLAEARARARVRLDALRVHAAALARRPGLPEEERRHVEGALGAYAEAVTALQEARDTDDVAALEPGVTGALAELARVAERVGADHPRADIFAGLCAVDPAHGPAESECAVEGRPGRPVCTACADAAAQGARLVPRRIPVEGGALPFTAAGAPL